MGPCLCTQNQPKDSDICQRCINNLSSRKNRKVDYAGAEIKKRIDLDIKTVMK